MIGVYANQTATWKKRTGVNEYNEPSFAASQTIKCRLEPRLKMVRNREGQEVVSESVLYTESAVSYGDVITVNGIDFPVINAYPMPRFNGSTAYYEVRL